MVGMKYIVVAIVLVGAAIGALYLKTTHEEQGRRIREDRRELEGRLSRSRMKSILLTIQYHTLGNGGKWPNRLEDIEADWEPDRQGRNTFREALVNPTSPDSPGYIYAKPESETVEGTKDRYRTPILYESRDGKPDPKGWIGYADFEIERAR